MKIHPADIHKFDQALAGINYYLGRAMDAWREDPPEYDDYSADICLLSRVLAGAEHSVICDILAVAIYRLMKAEQKLGMR